MQRLPITIEDALVAFVQAIEADCTVIWAKQDSPQPEPPFIVLDIIAGPLTVGPAEERYKQEDTFTFGIRKRATLNVQVHAEDAPIRAAAVEAALELPSRLEVLQAARIAIWGSEGVKDLTELVDTAYDPRAGLDIYISWPEPANDAPGEIRRVQTAGTIEGLTVDTDIDTEA
jgi:hypothetical protein